MGMTSDGVESGSERAGAVQVENLHPVVMNTVARKLGGSISAARAVPEGVEVQVTRYEDGSVVATPAVFGRNGGLVVGVTGFKAVSKPLLCTSIGSWVVVGVREDGTLLCERDGERAWAFRKDTEQ